MRASMARALRLCACLLAVAAVRAAAAVTGNATLAADAAAILAAALPFARSQLLATAKSGLPEGQYPDLTLPSGRWQTTGPERWTAGYLCGCYWKMHALTGSRPWSKLATKQLPGLEVYSNKGRLSHDFTQSYVEALRAKLPKAPLPRYRRVIKKVAAVWEGRYSKKVGAIRSWGKVTDKEEFKVIMDSMASLFLMPLAASLPGGKPEWRDIAMSHARKVARDHFRRNGSTYHVVVYDPRTGRRLSQGTHQGYSDSSTWSRGQAWAVIGFTSLYDEMREPALLATARRAADYFLLRMREAKDGVPLWDFDVPRRAKQPYKDSSAAAIAAAGLLRLGPLSGNSSYTSAGVRLLQSLVRPGGYLSRDAPAGSELASILRNGSFSVPAGSHSTGLIWGDYFFLDALVQLKQVAAD